MIENNKMKNSINIILLILIILVYSGFCFLTINNIIRYVIIFFLTMSSIVVNKNQLRINTYLLYVLSFIYIFLIISFLNNLSQYSSYFQLFIAIFVAFCIVSCIQFEYFIDLFIKCMYIIAFFSLIIFLSNLIINKMNPSLLDNWPYKVNNSANTVVNNYFLSVYQISYRAFDRNFGPFWEPGAYQTFLILALYFTLFYKKNNNKKHIFIFGLTIISTFSTTGIIALFLLLFLAFFNYLNNKKNEYNKRKINIVVTLLLFIVLAFFTILLIPKNYTELVFGKLSGILSGDYASGSTSTRIYAFIEPIKAMFKKSIFGLGYRGLNQYAIEVGYLLNTCTITNWFGMYGLMIGLIFNYYYIMFVWQKNYDIITKLGLTAMMLIIIFSEDYNANAFIYIIICYSILNRYKEKLNKLNKEKLLN